MPHHLGLHVRHRSTHAIGQRGHLPLGCLCQAQRQNAICRRDQGLSLLDIPLLRPVEA